MKHLLWLIAILATPAFAQEPTVPATLNLTWNLPTQTEDGTALTGPLALTKVQVFVATAPIANNSTMAPTVELAGGATGGTHTLSVPNGSTVFARVKACHAFGCSAFSNEDSKLVTVSLPGVPTNLQMQLQITP